MPCVQSGKHPTRLFTTGDLTDTIVTPFWLTKDIHSLVEGIIQITILALTFFKRNTAAPNGLRRNPVVELLIRDGALVFAALAGESLHHIECIPIMCSSQE